MPSSDSHAKPPAASDRKPRVDGQQARVRLHEAALRLFSEQGFAATSIRAIAQAACTNVAAIRYYFGDKQSLYRAVFMCSDPAAAQTPAPGAHLASSPETDLRVALSSLMRHFVTSTERADELQRARLLYREMLEPTGAWSDLIDQPIRQAHDALVHCLCQSLGLRRSDDDVHRLAFAIVGMGLQWLFGHDVIQALRPSLRSSRAAQTTSVERLVEWSLSLVQAEAQRRGRPLSTLA